MNPPSLLLFSPETQVQNMRIIIFGARLGYVRKICGIGTITNEVYTQPAQVKDLLPEQYTELTLRKFLVYILFGPYTGYS